MDRLTTVFRASKKMGGGSVQSPRCTWAPGKANSYLPTCVDGCANHPDLLSVRRPPPRFGYLF